MLSQVMRWIRSKRTGEPNLLPEKYEFHHDYCFFLHRILLDTFLHGIKVRAFHTKIDFESAEEAESFEKLTESEIFDWLEEYKDAEYLGPVLLDRMFPALLSDSLHFIYESITCARKGKLTVAYALLRKPLLESIHYLEWLLARPNEFLTMFWNEETESISMQSLGNYRKDVVAEAIALLPEKDTLDLDSLIDGRYSKTQDSFYRLCNMALHLVTTHNPHVATGRQNLNFIFAEEDEDAREDLLGFYFEHLPYLLYYMTEICTHLLAMAGGVTIPNLAKRMVKRNMGLYVWGVETYDPEEEVGEPENCPKCNNPGIRVQQAGMLYYFAKTRCSLCRAKVRLEDYILS